MLFKRSSNPDPFGDGLSAMEVYKSDVKVDGICLLCYIKKRTSGSKPFCDHLP